MRKIFLQSVIALSAITAFMSCSKDIEAFNASAIEEKQKNDYTSSFVAKYGPIDPNQSWDFTTGERRLATRGATTISTTIMENGISWGDVSKIKTVKQDDADAWNHTNIVIENDNATEKNGALLNAMVKALPEGVGRTGQSVVLVAPSSGFWIYPLFSGGLLTYDLKVKVGNQEPVTVFTKDWINFQTVNGMKKVINKNGEYVEDGTVNMKGIYIEAPVGTAIEVYIDNIYCYTKAAGNDAYEKAFPSPAGTTNGRAIYVDIDKGIRPEIEGVTLKENAVIKYIGIEDISAGAPLPGDNDFNDLVLAVIGDPDVPQEKIITENQYEVTTCRAKRYMIEDLGAIGDFDFNDVVIDVEEYTVYTHKVTSENGVMTSDEIISTTTAPTKAFIRALGGTIDFELHIGDTKWVKSESEYNTATMYNTQGTIDYTKALAEFEVTGYNYDNNNITFHANGKDGKLYTVTFPKKGEAPMMIAVDPTQKWMNERVSVPKSWFYLPE
jgi:hypothetical protein